MEEETKVLKEHASKEDSSIHDHIAKVMVRNSIGTTIKNKVITFFKDKYNIGFVIILFIAFLLRMKYINQESLWNDSAVHLWFAIKVTKEPLFLFTRPYLMGDYAVPQTIMAIFYLFTGKILLAGKIVTMVYTLAGVTFIYYLGKELHSKLAGLFAALLLAFNHIFWFYSSRPLADSPLLVTTIALLYFLVKLEKEKKVIYGVITGLLFLVAMFTKVQSVLLVFGFLIYYLIFKRKEMIKEKAILLSWMIPVGTILLAHIFGKIFFKTAVLDRILDLIMDLRGIPFGLEALGMVQWIYSFYIILFFLIGLIFVIVYRQKLYYGPIIILFFYYLFFELNVDNTQDRYMLPVLSLGVVVAVFGIIELINLVVNSVKLNHQISKFIKVILPLIVVVFVCWNYYQIGDQLNYQKSFTYTGYEEAGTWLKQNVPTESMIIAGEYRSIRLFAENEFGGPAAGEDDGGNVWNLRSPYRFTESFDNVSKKNFEEDVKNFSKYNDVYLEIDVWEYYQPSWYWPLRQESLDYFASLGFQMMHVVQRDVLTNDGLKKAPVIFILKKNKEQ